MWENATIESIIFYKAYTLIKKFFLSIQKICKTTHIII